MKGQWTKLIVAWNVALTILLFAVLTTNNTVPAARAQEGTEAKKTPTVYKKMNAGRIDNFSASDSPTPGALLALDGSGKFPASSMPDTVVQTTGSAIMTGGVSASSLRSQGDIAQELPGNGTVKFGALIDCRDSGSSVVRGFDNVASASHDPPFSIADGTGAGRCSVHSFLGSLEDRYVVATPYNTLGTVRGVTITNIDNGDIEFLRYDQDMNGVDGYIFLLVY